MRTYVSFNAQQILVMTLNAVVLYCLVGTYKGSWLIELHSTRYFMITGIVEIGSWK